MTCCFMSLCPISRRTVIRRSMGCCLMSRRAMGRPSYGPPFRGPPFHEPLSRRSMSKRPMGCFMSCHPTRVIVVLVFDSVLSFARHACLSLVGVRLDQCDAYHTRSSDLPINDMSCLVLNKVAVLDPGDLKQNLVYGASPGDQMINAMVPHFHAKFMIHEWTGLSHGGRSSEPHRTAS